MGDGVNTFGSPYKIKKSEAVASLNTSSRSYPALKVRPGSTSMYGSAATPLTSVRGAYARAGTDFHVVDGTTWKRRDGSTYTDVATGLATTQAKFLEFTTAIAKFSIMFNGTDKKAWDGTSVTDLTAAPATNIIAADDSRMYALTGSSLYTSDIGDITNWTTGDSDRIGLYGMLGSGTALAVFNDMKIAWSDRTMHVVLGKVSDDFDPSEPLPVGNVSNNATLIHAQSGGLYWLAYNKFMVYTGGFPIDISQKVKTYLEAINYTYKANIVAGQWGRYIYLSFPSGASTTNNLTLEYDTELKTWYPWNVGFSNFYNIGQDLYGITAAGVILKLNQGTADDTTAIVWSHTTGVWNAQPVKNRKTVSDIWAVIDLPVGSTLSVLYSTSTDNEDFVAMTDIPVASANEQNVRMMIPTSALQHIDAYRLRFSGVGPCTIHFLEPDEIINPR
jgi:hypothetical protein